MRRPMLAVFVSVERGDRLIFSYQPDRPIKDPGKVHLEAIYRNYVNSGGACGREKL